MRRVLPPSFFNRPTLAVARDFLGKYLVRKVGGKTTAVMITEVEAYDGPRDRACHAHRGRTERNAVMFGAAGCWYVYFVYGMHWMLNIVTGEAGYPAAVLLRGGGESFDATRGKWDGPGKLTKALAVDRRLNGKAASRASGLWIEDRGTSVAARHVRRTERIGVAYAGSWAKKPYRFVLSPSPCPLPRGGGGTD
ncbi:MAG: DNA-3-methyladenine glycosylase [Candidatus Peribacteraceae bacterium]|nr:DNA-3-methyladenine glycosylase [Candidatus Peribacteraceae bacterium]